MATASFHTPVGRDDLLARAADVYSSLASSPLALTARDAARALVGIAGWVANKVGVDGMQERMSQLVRHQDAWTSGLASMPMLFDGRVDELMAMIAVFASGLYHVFGADKLRSAMAFWATERDSAVWQQVAA